MAASSFRCTRCNRPFHTDDALKSHLWSKPRCLEAAPTSLREAVEKDIREWEDRRRTMKVCPACKKEFSTEEGLHAHFWSKPECLSEAPEDIQEEFAEAAQAWEQRAAQKTECCGGCSRTFGSRDAFKAHLYGRYQLSDSSACWKCAPPDLRSEIEKEVQWLASMFRCAGCSKSFEEKDSLLQHLSCKDSCLEASPDKLKNEVYDSWR